MSHPDGRYRHLALVGCTASGKSSLAMEVVRHLNASGAALGPPVEVVCVDSMQVYRGMDIGTSKPPPADQAEVAHHMIDLVDPDEVFTVTRFQAAATVALGAIEARGHRALVVGGTGLYFRSVVDGLTPPGQFPELRAELEADADTAGLHRRLSQVDPLAASRILPTNRRRVVRALEASLGTGRPFSSFGPGIGTYPRSAFRMAGLWLPRAVVARRIEQRFAHMMAAGLAVEVGGLRDRTRGLSRTARQALGYRELLGHLDDGTPLDAAVDQAVRRTRAFARRQRVWWRRDPRISWYGAQENPLAVLPALLGDWSRP